MSPTKRIALCLAVLACSSIQDASGPAYFTEITLEIPSDFEGAHLGPVVIPDPSDAAFATGVYASPVDSVRSLSWDDGLVSGFIINFPTPWEARDRHADAANRILGDRGVPRDMAGSTLYRFGCRFFYDNDIAFVFFHISRFTILLRVDPNGNAQSVALRRAVRLAENIFRVNDLLDTWPEERTMLRLVSVTPDPSILLRPDVTTTFSVRVLYALAEPGPWVVIVTVSLEGPGRGIRVTDTISVDQGRAELTLNITHDLVSATSVDELQISGRLAPVAEQNDFSHMTPTQTIYTFERVP